MTCTLEGEREGGRERERVAYLKARKSHYVLQLEYALLLVHTCGSPISG